MDDRRLSERSYWDSLYGRSIRYPAPEPTDHIWKRFVAFFDTCIPRGPGRRVLEVGCAFSQFLPLFRRRYGCEVHGLDYSDIGCQRTVEGLAGAGIELGGGIHCRDLFGDLSDLEGRFDAVVSLGLVEHFAEPASVLAVLRRLLVPGGTLITEIPNTAGAVFALFRWLDEPIFRMHGRFDRSRFRRVHEEAGLVVVRCDYFGTVNLGVLSSARCRPIVKTILSIASKAQQVCLSSFERLDIHPETATMSPYLVCVARAGTVAASESVVGTDDEDPSGSD